MQSHMRLGVFFSENRRNHPGAKVLKNIAKTELLTPKNVLCPCKPLDLGYGSGLSERSKGKQKQTVEQSQTNCQLKQICRLHVKHD